MVFEISLLLLLSLTNSVKHSQLSEQFVVTSSFEELIVDGQEEKNIITGTSRQLDHSYYHDDGGLSTAQIIGICVGAAVLIIGIIIVVCYRRSRNNQEQAPPQIDPALQGQPYPEPNLNQNPDYPPAPQGQQMQQNYYQQPPVQNNPAYLAPGS